ILDILLKYANNHFDDIIIVGGYKYEELVNFIEDNYKNRAITLVQNTLFKYGSNISLIDGIKALEKNYDEIIFIEGDLVIDRVSFNEIVEIQSDIITSTTLPIEAKTSVIYYVNKDDKIVFKYDTKHKLLKIDEAFKSISNSGQIWKFCNMGILKEIANSFGNNDLNLTNLATIEPYFNKISKPVQHYQIKQWFNCNTIDDYRKAIKYLKEE
ncbi:MAG: hypothetical protein KAU90_09375, partial [Sulfurovaceae bacterium]|nr:hypothetical protein [Sulfurovaceae bacterium]